MPGAPYPALSGVEGVSCASPISLFPLQCVIPMLGAFTGRARDLARITSARLPILVAFCATPWSLQLSRNPAGEIF
jgi:hypothetical protein